MPATVKAYTELEWDVVVESEAGLAAGFPDADYVTSGASIVHDPAAAHDADLVIRVGPPTLAEIALIPRRAVLCSFLDPFVATDLVAALADGEITALAMEAIPRTTLAQSMDALSSQATVGGYAAVLLAATASPKFLPMLVTAAGTIPPAKALILGAGVAGLQAIATARRLGAVVHGYDIRAETKEQVESLGAKFVEAPTESADEGGYAKEVATDVQQQQFEILAPFVADADIIVTTAQIPGRPAPLLITAEMVAAMRPGSVIVDMAAATGGNVAGVQADGIVEIDGVAIHGPTDLPSRVPTDASRMYARNLQDLITRMQENGGLVIDLDDEIIGGTTITHAGDVIHPRSRQVLGLDSDEGASP